MKQFKIDSSLSLLILAACMCFTNAGPSLKSNPVTKIYPKSISSQMKLLSRTMLFLQISQDGTVSGTTSCVSEYVKLEQYSVGTGLIRIKGLKTGRYLAMNSAGVVYSAVSATQETVFRETMVNSGYHTYASLKFYKRKLYDTFVALRKDGTMKLGTRRSFRIHKSAQFLVIKNIGC